MNIFVSYDSNFLIMKSGFSIKLIVTLQVTLFYTLCSAFTEPTATIKLYPKGQDVDFGVSLGPGESNGITQAMEEKHRHVYSKVTDPFINIYLPEKCNGQMLVICPGGGYRDVWSVHEGESVAEWAVSKGIAACVVIYRLPNQHSKVPLTDVQNAFRYCRSKSAEWGVKQIGVVGFSAGGHLAASASTLFTDAETRPDFSILIYPVITFEASTHGGTKRHLIGENPSQEMVDYYSLEKRVTPSTPPAFIALSRDDNTVPPVNSIRYYEALLRNGVSGELHIYTKGGHGWGWGKRFPEDIKDTDKLEEQRTDFIAAVERWLKYIKEK